ncbi:hypothetical protein I4U23_006236 [Adineta vaga]|nr:hypothetical protein I4U23_006236 [Adineta vaga]
MAKENPTYVISDQNKKCCRSISVRELCKIITQILIPLMIGIFTIVITLQQHYTGKENRKKDLEIAAELRQQQLRLDEQRRSQELALDEARRAQDLSIADNNHRDSVFNIYIRDLSNLLLINNYNLSRPLLNSIIRPMTLTVLRQIDSSRKILLLKFLYESKMIRTDFEDTRVDLSDADLSHIHFGAIHMQYLSLPGALLINTTFVRTDLTFADFQRADLTDSIFMNSTLAEVSFYRTRLIRAQFFHSNFFRTDLSLADLTQSTITLSQLQTSSSYNEAILPNGEKTSGKGLITSEDRCSLKNWNIHPVNTINLTNHCQFVGLQDDISMRYDLHIYIQRRLFEKQHALLELHLKASMQYSRKMNVTFIFYKEENTSDEIDRRSGITIAEITEPSDKSLSKQWISATYPRNARFLTIDIAINKGDRLSDFEFYIQHFDYMQV